MSKAWDTAVIKADANHPDAGRAGVVQNVERNPDGTDKVLSIRLDETADGKPVKVVNATPDQVNIHNVN
ncbi:hypothetical protein [Burkholderia sp. F1]|uniref:hypothetical protein n=1 Tax=Burkholderia sp. F1 TaxID=3366817 RepID=UPI003D7065E3